MLESKICINIRIDGNICIKYQESTFEKDNTFWYPVTDVNKPSKACVVVVVGKQIPKNTSSRIHYETRGKTVLLLEEGV